MHGIPVIVCAFCLVAGWSPVVAESEWVEAQPAVIWAKGLTRNESTQKMEGWYDVDKNQMVGDKDDNMCYAASAANLVAWWQDGEYGRNLTSTSPTELNDIWDEYLEKSQNSSSGGDPLAAINWWISGVYAPSSPANADEIERSIFNPLSPDRITLRQWEGYYYDRYGLTRDHLTEFLSYTSEYTASSFGNLLSGGAGISLFLKSDTGGLAHAITLWGVEYTERDILSKIWVTDSDDGDSNLFSIDVKTGLDGRIYFNEAGDIGAYDWYEMLGITGIHIHGVSAIHPEASAHWQLVPEPTAATLLLPALACLATRRRRRVS